MNTTIVHPGFKAEKNQQIMDGTARLFAERKPGQTFTHQEIADACGVHRRAIQIIERKAFYKVACRLREKMPELFIDELGNDTEIGKLFKRLSPDGEKALGVKSRTGVIRHFAKVRHNAANGEMTQEEIVERIRADRLANPFRHRTPREKSDAYLAATRSPTL